MSDEQDSDFIEFTYWPKGCRPKNVRDGESWELDNLFLENWFERYFLPVMAENPHRDVVLLGDFSTRERAFWKYSIKINGVVLPTEINVFYPITFSVRNLINGRKRPYNLPSIQMRTSAGFEKLCLDACFLGLIPPKDYLGEQVQEI